ncbi:DNA-processing protein DprA [Mobilicoccus pelagius]|uniref:DNA processing protein n=1 Tax=Mobilicoccus pelagius NBRC 104925 TaxID=1089455 RepID=H5UN86_9MICO|nr:DNA-processing protein DprA [Mobilicoccus pelagius]GAB47194.1 DNA processing protein [Mobilicoccus pelagius NBRC 104925]
MTSTSPGTVGPQDASRAATVLPGLGHPVLDAVEAGLDGLDPEVLARVAWSALAEPGDPVASRLVRELGAVGALRALLGRSESALDRFRPRLTRLDLASVLDDTAACAARLLVPTDPEWPLGLGDLACPPHVLWVRGPLDLGAAMRRSVAVVGARAATAYGESVAADIAAGLAERDVTVVSGGAFGIDAAAHRGVLAVGGRTVAVLAGGVDRPYPAAHHRLLGHVADTGALVSEMPPGATSLRSRFLLRNRLIATMTLGTVVVEAGRRSGSRNTAGTAAAHHRVVVAVPGPVTSIASVGCHEMIRSGMAQLVTDADEVVELVGVMGEDLAPETPVPRRPGDGLDGADRGVFEVLPRRKAADVERLSVLAGETENTVRAALGRLELLGLARRTDDGWRLA